MQNRVHQVSSMVIREGYDSMNMEISDRYRHSKVRDEDRMRVRSHHHLVGNHQGEEIPEI